MNILAALFPNSYAKESSEKKLQNLYCIVQRCTFQPRRVFFQVLHPGFLFSGKCRSLLPLGGSVTFCAPCSIGKRDILRKGWMDEQKKPLGENSSPFFLCGGSALAGGGGAPSPFLIQIKSTIAKGGFSQPRAILCTYTYRGHILHFLLSPFFVRRCGGG